VGGSSIFQAPLTTISGPFALDLSTSGTQAWVAQDTSIGHLDTDSSTLIVVCADLVSFTPGATKDFCGDRTVVLNSGWQLFISNTGLPALVLDDNPGPAVSASLTAASAVAGKHAYLIRWIGATQQARLAGEHESTALSFAGRSPSTPPQRFGSARRAAISMASTGSP
jgi:hypothetical protein